MPPSRRLVLRMLCAGVTVGPAGCLTSVEFRPEEHVADWQDEPVRGKRPPIEVEAKVDIPHSLEDQCDRRAPDAVEASIRERIESAPSLRVDHTRSSALPDAGWIIIAYREMILGPNGEVMETPEARFAEIHEAAPSAIDMTVGYGNVTRSCSFDVYVSDTYQQMD